MPNVWLANFSKRFINNSLVRAWQQFWMYANSTQREKRELIMAFISLFEGAHLRFSALVCVCEPVLIEN